MFVLQHRFQKSGHVSTASPSSKSIGNCAEKLLGCVGPIVAIYLSLQTLFYQFIFARNSKGQCYVDWVTKCYLKLLSVFDSLVPLQQLNSIHEAFIYESSFSIGGNVWQRKYGLYLCNASKYCLLIRVYNGFEAIRIQGCNVKFRAS